jgi:hypothetical protein
MPPTHRLSVRCVDEYSGWFLEGIKLWLSFTLPQSVFTRDETDTGLPLLL